MLLEPMSSTDDFCSCPKCECLARHRIIGVDVAAERPTLPAEARALLELARGASDMTSYSQYIFRAMRVSGLDSLPEPDPPLGVTRQCVICGHEWKKAL